MNNLKDDREYCDYEVFSFIDQETAENAISQAKRFFEEAKIYLEKWGSYEN